jgi:predicted nucleic acid-binding protein
VIISDTNILSSFAAAKGLPLLFDILHEDVIYISPSVHQELLEGLAYGVSYLAEVIRLVERGKLKVLEITEQDRRQVASLPPSFGPGEKEATVLCLREKASLLSNEKRVVNYCLRNDITCLNLKALLRLLWKDGLVSKAKVKTMMVQMTKVEGIVFKTTKEIFAD